MNEKRVTIRLRRDSAGTTDEYSIPFESGMSALSAVRTIYETMDRTVAYPLCLCRMGRCGACAMRINGKAELGCGFALEEGTTYLIEPINDKKLIRDLVCE